MLNICEFSITMSRGRKTMQKYSDFKGGPEGREEISDKPCTGNFKKHNRIFFIKDNLHM